MRRGTCGPARVAVGAAMPVLLAAGALVVQATGGTQHAWLHILYVPILLAAGGFGVVGGVVAGVAAGLVVGPAMPVDVAAGVLQEPHAWLFRLLHNRTTFRRLVATRLAEDDRPFGLALIHLDQLRAVLWRYGHDDGELVLRVAARRLQELQVPDDLVCLYGDAELAVLRADVAGPLGRGELRLHYQPILHLASGRLVGFEALARWQHPDHGLVAPAAFVPVAPASPPSSTRGRCRPTP